MKRYKYVGKERDEETGLYYYGARYYSAWLGRFVSVDPLAGKFPNISPFLNAKNNPISYYDLNGESASPYYTKEGKFLGVDEKGFSGQVMITSQDAWEKVDNDSNGKVKSKEIQKHPETQSYDNALLPNSSKGLIQTHIVNKKLNDGVDIDREVLIVHNEKLQSFYRHGVTHPNISVVLLGIANEKEHIQQLKSDNETYLDRSLYFETTVENIRNIVNLHEVKGHGINKITGEDNRDHYKAYKLQIESPQFAKTTDNFKSYILSTAFMYYNKANKNILETKNKNLYYKYGFQEYKKFYKWYKGE